MSDINDEKRKNDEVVHVSRIQQEILFQLLVRNPDFADVPVGKLRNFCYTAIAQIRNYDYYFRHSEKTPKKN